MNIVSTLWGIVDPKRPSQGWKDMVDAGFEYAALEFNWWQDGCGVEILDLSARIAFIKRQKEADEYIESIEDFAKRIQEAIPICGMYHCTYMVIPPIIENKEDCSLWEMNQEFFLKFAELAKHHNVQILLTNTAKENNGRYIRSIGANAHETACMLDAWNQTVADLLQEESVEIFGMCMDVGICNLCGQDMHEYAIALGKRIKAVILRDGDGHVSSAQLPFTCAVYGRSRTDWLSLFRGLREIEFDGELVMDFGDTACACSQLLRPQLLVLAKSVAEYIKWQIEIETHLKKYEKIVLFGAGNMCRNYMKCYGEKYPPLFTCDNNVALWGSRFCGLEIRSPESLKELPEDCTILICNVYYREIENQLRKMGIKNHISFFNDEYMPAYHVDRIER